MQCEYRMKGGDGQEYGPVGLVEMQSWVAQNRVNADTLVRRDDGEWQAAGRIQELGLGPAPAAPPHHCRHTRNSRFPWTFWHQRFPKSTPPHHGSSGWPGFQ